jgi:hypothetical protein
MASPEISALCIVQKAERERFGRDRQRQKAA